MFGPSSWAPAAFLIATTLLGSTDRAVSLSEIQRQEIPPPSVTTPLPPENPGTTVPLPDPVNPAPEGETPDDGVVPSEPEQVPDETVVPDPDAVIPEIQYDSTATRSTI
jgi:hypothetical protein